LVAKVSKQPVKAAPAGLVPAGSVSNPVRLLWPKRPLSQIGSQTIFEKQLSTFDIYPYICGLIVAH
jgi:hypothetical protein